MFRDVIYELGRGAAYLSIKHRGLSVYTITLPTLLFLLLTGIYFIIPIKPVLLGKDGAISAGLSMLSTLPGFYFAGLAAVATFGSAQMDNEMPPPAPEINLRVQGQSTPTKLTRRLYLSYMFSYLVVISFALCFLLLMLNLLAPSLGSLHAVLIKLSFGGAIWYWAKAFTVMLIAGLFSSMLITTLHGVFFLTEKIHQP